MSSYLNWLFCVYLVDTKNKNSNIFHKNKAVSMSLFFFRNRSQFRCDVMDYFPLQYAETQSWEIAVFPPWATQGWIWSKTVWNMCPWEGNAVCLCWQQWYHPCSAPQREKRKERGQLRKRADMERNKPVIAWDSGYSAKSITTPVNSLSIVVASSSQFRYRTFQRTRTGFRCVTATWD